MFSGHKVHRVWDCAAVEHLPEGLSQWEDQQGPDHSADQKCLSKVGIAGLQEVWLWIFAGARLISWWRMCSGSSTRAGRTASDSQTCSLPSQCRWKDQVLLWSRLTATHNFPFPFIFYISPCKILCTSELSIYVTLGQSRALFTRKELNVSLHMTFLYPFPLFFSISVKEKSGWINWVTFSWPILQGEA